MALHLYHPLQRRYYVALGTHDEAEDATEALLDDGHPGVAVHGSLRQQHLARQARLIQGLRAYLRGAYQDQ